MNQPNFQIKKEIRALAKYQSLIYSRAALLLSTFLSIFYYFIHRYSPNCFYIFLVVLLFPTFLEVVPREISNASPKKTVIFPTLQKMYNFKPLRFACLHVTFWITNILLVAWKYSIYKHPKGASLANFLPSLFLFGHIFLYLFLSYYYQIKIHYQLQNNQW